MTNNNIIFDIVIDNNKKPTKGFFKKLMDTITGKVRAPRRDVIAKNILEMYKKTKLEQQSAYAFRIKDQQLSFDFITSEENRFYESNKKLNLMSEFEKIVELLSSFYEQPKKEEVFEIEIVLSEPKPKTKKVYKVKTFDKITIFERWVKIGFDMYRRQFNASTGNEYIVVDGDVYYIKYDRNGNEILV